MTAKIPRILNLLLLIGTCSLDLAHADVLYEEHFVDVQSTTGSAVEKQVTCSNRCDSNAECVVINYCMCHAGYQKIDSSYGALPYCAAICPNDLVWNTKFKLCLQPYQVEHAINGVDSQLTAFNDLMDVLHGLEFCNTPCGPHASCLKLEQCICKTGYKPAINTINGLPYCREVAAAKIIMQNNQIFHEMEQSEKQAIPLAIDTEKFLTDYADNEDADNIIANDVNKICPDGYTWQQYTCIQNEHITTTTTTAADSTTSNAYRILNIMTETTYVIDEKETFKRNIITIIGTTCLVGAGLFLIVVLYRATFK